MNELDSSVLESAETKLYELMILVPGSVSADEAEKVFVHAKDEITKVLGGKITHEELWGRRELAYKIGREEKGYYFVVQCELEAKQAPVLNNFCRMEREIIRHMLIILPEGFKPVDYSAVKTGFGSRPASLVKEEKEAREASDAKREKRVADSQEAHRAAKKVEEKAEKVEHTEKTEEVKAEKHETEKKPKLDRKLDQILDDLGEDLNI